MLDEDTHGKPWDLCAVQDHSTQIGSSLPIKTLRHTDPAPMHRMHTHNGQPI